MAFKPDEDMDRYIRDEAETQGWTVTTVIEDMLKTQKELEEVLGDDWWEVEKLAFVEKKSKGQVLGELVRSGMSSRLKSR
jgi:hypothetical protein